MNGIFEEESGRTGRRGKKQQCFGKQLNSLNVYAQITASRIDFLEAVIDMSTQTTSKVYTRRCYKMYNADISPK